MLGKTHDKNIYLRLLNNTFVIYETYRYILLVINYTRDLLVL
jgi:hypothetical protein